MVARGDLGVEIGYENVPAAERRINAVGKLYGKALYNSTAKKFVHFELIAAGTRKGLRDKDDYLPAPIGFAFTIEGQPERAGGEEKRSSP